MAAHRAVLFDLDGTLLDTIEDLTDSINAALGAMGLGAVTVAQCKVYVGDGLREFAARALPLGQRDEAAIARCMELTRQEYARRWHGKTRPYEGVADMLDALAERHLPMSVLSNKPDDFTRLVVARMLGDWRFEVVRGMGPDGIKKPDPAAALAIAAHCGLKPAEFLYVGDTNTDMATAAAAGMLAVGATWGFRPAEELRRHGAKALIDRPMDLLDLLA